jgi:hypothetical protein
MRTPSEISVGAATPASFSTICPRIQVGIVGDDRQHFDAAKAYRCPPGEGTQVVGSNTVPAPGGNLLIGQQYVHSYVLCSQ